MPRFIVDSEYSSSPAVNEESILPRRARGRGGSRGKHVCVTRSLSCLSPDGRTMYTVNNIRDEFFVEAHSLPLEGYTQDEIAREFPAVIRTKLPPTVSATLKVDTPVELFCADSNEMSHPPRDKDACGPQQCLLPLLCLYSRHSVFLLQLAFQCPFDKNNLVTGKVVSFEEPLESRLVSESTSATIVRVRPAPHQQMGYATMCPPGSLAMLMHDTYVNEYSLVLYHGPHQSRPDGWISCPLNIGFEQLEDDEENVITDFCFGQSNGHPLLATMTVHLLKASGDVIGASPILFDGAVVPRSFVRESKEFLEYMGESDSDSAKRRQCLAALQFFRDAIGPDDSDTPYVTARTSTVGSTENSLSWPVSAQGPVLLSSMEPDEEWNRAIVIEPFFARDLVGMAVGRERTGVDFGVTPTSSLLPRFDYMDGTDQEEINSMLVNLGVVVERVLVDAGEGEVPDSPFITLVRDPVVDNMIHYASSQGVVSITTNAMRLYSNKIRGETGAAGFMSPSTQRNEEVKSMAWSSLDVSAGDHRLALIGAVVSSDALLGHTLVAALSNGKEAVAIGRNFLIGAYGLTIHLFLLQEFPLLSI